MSISSPSRFSASGDSHSRLESGPVQSVSKPLRSSHFRFSPELRTLEYMAASGLLPGLTKSKRPRPGVSISYENETSTKDMRGTSPVASACVAAAMTANIPMAIATTLRQISEENKIDNTKTKLLISKNHASPSEESKASFNSPSPKIFINDASANSPAPDVPMDHRPQSDTLAYTLTQTYMVS